MTRDQQFEEELISLINRYSKENGSDTPDWILARYLINCLDIFDMTIIKRETYYDRTSRDNQIVLSDPKQPELPFNP